MISVNLLNMLNSPDNITSNAKQTSDSAGANQGTSFADLLLSMENELSGNTDMLSGDSSTQNNYLNLLSLMSSMNNSNLSNSSSDQNNINSILQELTASIENSNSFTDTQKESIKTELTKLSGLLNTNGTDTQDAKKMSELVMLNFLNSQLKAFESFSSDDSDTGDDGNSSDAFSITGMGDYVNQLIQASINNTAAPVNAEDTPITADNTDTDQNADQSKVNSANIDPALYKLNNELNNYYDNAAANAMTNSSDSADNSVNDKEVDAKIPQPVPDDQSTDKVDSVDTTPVIPDIPDLNGTPNSSLDQTEAVKNLLQDLQSVSSDTSDTKVQSAAAPASSKANNLYDIVTNIIKNMIITETAAQNNVKDKNAKSMPVQQPAAIIENLAADDSINNMNALYYSNQQPGQDLSEGEKDLKILKAIKANGGNDTNSDDSLSSSRLNQFMNMLSTMKSPDNVQENVQTTIDPVISQNTFVQDIIKTVQYMENNNVKNLTVKIQPKDLGELVIKLTTENGVMKANITATTKEGYNLLNSSLTDLSSKLNNSEIKIQNLTLSMYNDASGNQGQSYQGGSSKNNSRLKTLNYLFSDDDSEDIPENVRKDYSNLNILA